MTHLDVRLFRPSSSAPEGCGLFTVKKCVNSVISQSAIAGTSVSNLLWCGSNGNTFPPLSVRREHVHLARANESLWGAEVQSVFRSLFLCSFATYRHKIMKPPGKYFLFIFSHYSLSSLPLRATSLHQKVALFRIAPTWPRPLAGTLPRPWHAIIVPEPVTCVHITGINLFEHLDVFTGEVNQKNKHEPTTTEHWGKWVFLPLHTGKLVCLFSVWSPWLLREPWLLCQVDCWVGVVVTWVFVLGGA